MSPSHSASVLQPRPATPSSRAGLAVSLLVLLHLLILLGSACAAVDETGTAEPRPLTLERLYSLPRLIGTAPTGFAWSPDSSRVAFLWNDEGMNFRDVWVVAADGEASPVRWTRFPRAEHDGDAAASGPDPVAVAEAAERRERDPGAVAVSWHPDGERLLVSIGADLWLVGEGAPPLEALADARQPAFSPDGARLAFLRRGDLWLASSEGASPQRLTTLAGDAVRIASFRWSPDGGRIALLEADRSDVPLRSIPDYLADEPVMDRVRRAYPGDEPVRQRLGTLDIPNGEVQWTELSSPAPEMLLGYRWSPTGEHLAVDTSDLYAKDRRLFVVPGGGRGTARTVARDADAKNETFYFWRIEWSRDGDRLYFLSDRETDYHVWAVGPEGGEAVAVTSGPWAVAEMTALPQGLLVVGNRGRAEERHLFLVPPGADGRMAASDSVVRLSRRPGTHSPVVSPDGGWAAVAHSADDTPPEMLIVALSPAEDAESSAAAESGMASGAATSERPVTHSPLAEFEEYRWVTPEYVTFESHVDGSALHGRLTLPPDFDPENLYPAILGSVYTDSVRNQWGGRTAHPTWGLDQYLAQEGYVLLNVDVRGSWGRGRDHRRGIRLDYGGIDIDDLESGVRFLATLGYVDMERVGIWGSSYGGLMTTMSLFRKPGLYAAGVAGAPATNVGHALTGQMAVMMRPEDQPEEYADSSPYLHAHGLEDPLMIIHGMRDRIVLYKDSVVLTQRLLMLDRDVDLVTLPNAGHGWDNEGLAQTRFAFRKLVAHFDRHLKSER